MIERPVLSRISLLAVLFFAGDHIAGNCQPGSEYKLVFSDEFDGPVLSGNWYVSDCSPHGDELQVYRSGNVSVSPVSPGQLVLVARRAAVTGDTCPDLSDPYDFSSGSIVSSPFLYGYFEVRALLPGGCGAWPAVWLWSGQNNSQYSEIDIMEACGRSCTEYWAGFFEDDDGAGDADIHGTDHHDHAIKTGTCTSDGFNSYGLEWTPENLKFYFNGEEKFSHPNRYTHQPLSLILNLAIGNFASCLDCNVYESEFPRYFLIDYVHVYKKEKEIIDFKIDSAELRLGNSTLIYAPVYPDARYEWSASDSAGLQIAESPYNPYINAQAKPGFQGAWKTATITGLAAGTYKVNLNISFPDGFQVMKSIPVTVVSN